MRLATNCRCSLDAYSQSPVRYPSSSPWVTVQTRSRGRRLRTPRGRACREADRILKHPNANGMKGQHREKKGTITCEVHNKKCITEETGPPYSPPIGLYHTARDRRNGQPGTVRCIEAPLVCLLFAFRAVLQHKKGPPVGAACRTDSNSLHCILK